MAFPNAWDEVALVEVQKFDATTPLKWQFDALTETIDIDEGEAPGEGIATVSGGRLWKDGPRADGTITLEMYPVELDAADDADDKGLFQQYTGGTYLAVEPLITDTAWPNGTSRLKDRFMVTVLWTNDPAATTASGTTAASTDSLRFAAIECRMTAHASSFTDGILKVTATFKFPAFDKTGLVKCCRWESADQTAFVAIPDYDDEDSWT